MLKPIPRETFDSRESPATKIAAPTAGMAHRRQCTICGFRTGTDPPLLEG